MEIVFKALNNVSEDLLGGVTHNTNTVENRRKGLEWSCYHASVKLLHLDLLPQALHIPVVTTG
jgi:hypothetical protein